jgi:hypothetical protein
MKIRKIAAVLAGAIMLTSTVAIAAAANYSAPFVSGGNADVAIVYGSTAANTDLVAALEINSDLTSKLAAQTATTGTSASSASTSGETVSLGSGSSQIWLNTSLSTAKTVLTKTDLPTVLGEYTFSGNVDSKLTSTIQIGSNKVTFAKQPTSNSDPVIGISMNTSSGSPLYTASVTMPAINFTSSDSKGADIELFGQKFTVASATDSTSLVLFKSSQTVSLTNDNSNANLTIGDKSYSVSLVSVNSNGDKATIQVTNPRGVSETKDVSVSTSKKIAGMDVAVTSASANNFKYSATILLGAQKLTFTNGTQVLSGTSDDPVDGTLVTFTGGTTAMTSLNIAVYAPDSNSDAILPGKAFVDPVFGSFKVDFAGLSSNLNDSGRNEIKIDKSGDKGMSLSLTDSDGVAKTFDFAYNATTTFLGDSNSYRIKVQEKANLTENAYTIVGNEDYGHLVQVTRIYNNTGTDYTKDAFELKDVMSGDTYKADFTSEGSGKVTIDGRQYTVTSAGSGDSGLATLKYPTADSSATQLVVFPTIKTKGGALVSLYEPQTISLGAATALQIPDGDGYTAASIPANGTSSNVTIGRLVYNIANSSATNVATVKLMNPATSALIDAPAVIVIEGKDTNTNYNAIVVDLEANAAGTSTDPLGVNSVTFTSPTQYSSSLQSDSDITQDVDWYGTLVTEDSNTASQKVVTISTPSQQVQAKVYVGAASSIVTSSGSTSSGGSVKSLGSVAVADSEVSTVSGKSLIVVGGSCVNSVAAKLLGGASCGDSFATASGIKAGEALIKTFASPYSASKVATLVAGYNAADTTNAAKYLTTQTVDTTVGKGVKVTSATQAVALTSAA